MPLRKCWTVWHSHQHQLMCRDIDGAVKSRLVDDGVVGLLCHSVYCTWVVLDVSALEYILSYHGRWSLLGRAGHDPSTFWPMWAGPIYGPPTFFTSIRGQMAPAFSLRICLYCLNCIIFAQLILWKILKIDATRCHILRLKCTKFDFDWSSTADPTGGAQAPDPLAGFKGSYF